MGLEQSSLIWPAWRMSRAAKMIACWTLPRSRPACTCPASQHLTQPESGITRALYDCPDQRLGKTGKRVRLIVATHPAGATTSRVGLTRAGVIYELFLTALPQSAFTAALDRSQWRYFAALPQTRSSKDNFSYLDHLRHLLSNEPGLQRLHLQGGVDFWFLNNVEEMQKEALEVRDHRNIAFVRQQIANILYYLDGKCAPQDLTNAPGNTLPENAAIAHATSIGLLDCPLQSDPPGHITHIGLHLNGIAQAPGASPEQVKRAIEINRDLNPIKAWLVQMRADARQLAVMNDVQLAQAQALRNDLAIQADYAVNGRIDPATQALQPSVRQTCNIIELLANFDVMPYVDGPIRVWFGVERVQCKQCCPMCSTNLFSVCKSAF